MSTAPAATAMTAEDGIWLNMPPAIAGYEKNWTTEDTRMFAEWEVKILDRLNRCVEYLVGQGESFSGFLDAKRVMRAVRSKHTRTIGPMMWQPRDNGLSLRVLCETPVIEVRFIEHKDGHFVTEIAIVAERKRRPVGKHCAYCWVPYTGGKRCGLCRTACYCSEACRSMHWVVSHKNTCSRSFAPP